MGTAVGYALGNRVALTRYTEPGFLAIDNNASEPALGAVAVGRKNYLFAWSEGGGQSAAVLYSVIGTCRRLGLDAFAYLRDALARPPSLSAGRADELLPDRQCCSRIAVRAETEVRRKRKGPRLPGLNTNSTLQLNAHRA